MYMNMTNSESLPKLTSVPRKQQGKAKGRFQKAESRKQKSSQVSRWRMEDGGTIEVGRKDINGLEVVQILKYQDTTLSCSDISIQG
jgi:hypothetical protein